MIEVISCSTYTQHPIKQEEIHSKPVQPARFVHKLMQTIDSL